MRRIFFFTGLLPLILIGSACSKIKGAPSIYVTNPIEHTHFDNGHTFQIAASFTDNNGLASYQLTVSDASGNTLTDFGLDDSGSLSGKSHTYSGTVNIPNGIEGTYYLHFIVIDDEGKKNDKLHEFHVDN